MLTTTDSIPRVTPHGKFLSRSEQKFFFKAMRLADVSGSLDFGQKLKLRKRLDDLKTSHTTGLVLTEAQSQPCLDIAAQAGLVAMVELRISADELTSRRGFKAVVSRIAHTANIYSRHRALAGYILDCEIGQDALRAGGLENARRRVRSVVKTIKERAPEAMVGIKVRPETRALSILEEDFLYAEIPGARAARDSRFRRRPAQRRGSAAGHHRIQGCITGAGRSGSSGVWYGCGWRGCSAGSCSGFSRLARRAHDARVGCDAVRDAQRHLPAAAGEDADGVGGDLRIQRRAHDAAVPGVAAQARLPEFRGRHRR